MTLADVVLAKKWELDALRLALSPNALDGLEHDRRLDIIFTSNAIDGNTLTAEETARVLEQGATVVGKPLKDHLEAVDETKALAWVLDAARRNETPIREADLRTLHRLATEQSAPLIAGRYADEPRSADTSSGVFNFPAPAEIPALMAGFATWLAAAPDEPATAFEAHLRLVSIHPFSGGNGRTARLLMNLILARAGYPPFAIRLEDQAAYLRALETAQAGGGDAEFTDLMYRGLDRTLDTYLAAARQMRDAPAAAIPKRT
jgi:Fic family protein